MYRYFLLPALLLAGCASNNPWVTSGENRDEGTLSLGYSMGTYRAPEVYADEGLQMATAKCQAWGFVEADPSAGQTMECHERNEYGNCLSWQVNRTYHCEREADSTAQQKNGAAETTPL